MIPHRTLALVLVVGCSGAAWGQTCPASGLVLSSSGGRLGDVVSLSLSGTPLVSGLLGFDPVPGPVASPIGNLCIGLSQSLATAPFSLDSAGSYGFAGVLPAIPSLTGQTFFFQAAAQDMSQPSGFALSNGQSMTLRPPRLFVLSTGGFINFPAQFFPGTVRKYDALTDTLSPPTTLIGRVWSAITVRQFDWIVTAQTFLGGSGILAAYSASTLAFVQSVPLPAAIGPDPAAIAISGTTLFVGGPGGMFAYQLPSMTPLYSLSNPVLGTKGIVIVPGNPLGYQVLASPFSSSVVPFNLTTGAPSAAINVGGAGFGQIWGWTVGGNVIYFSFWDSQPPAPPMGAGVNGVDTVLNTPLFPGPVPLSFSASPTIRFGPGSAGPAVFVSSGQTILQLSPATLLATASPIATPGLTSLELSNGGTEWLINASGQVKVMNPATLTIAPTGVPGGVITGQILVLPSASINKAFLFWSFGSSQLTAFNTDPTTTAGATSSTIPGDPFPIYPFVIVD